MRSMTGCGVGRAQNETWEVTAELKTVNHRFLDISLRLPRNLQFLDQTVREGLTAGLRRGHVDVYLTVRNVKAGSQRVRVDEMLARSWLDAADALKKLGIQDDISVSRFLTLEGICTLEEQEMDEETVSRLCSQALTEAVGQVNAMRDREGENLRRDLSIHLQAVAALREKIVQRAPDIVTEYREKLQNRLSALLTEDLDPARLAQEVAIMADRCAIDEELARLQSHLDQMSSYLDSTGETGKKMDFLIQEMNRETNTIGSKANDAAVAQLVVDLKSEIEKLREQIQNVE